MILLGFDTATPATTVGLRLADGSTLQARDDPGPDEHPGHATRLLAMAHELLVGAGLRFGDLDRIAVGLGPGTFTGLRVGVATARGLAQSLGVELAGVSSLRALAEPALRAQGESSSSDLGGRWASEARTQEAWRATHASDRGRRGAPSSGRLVLGVLDARRGEVFVAAYELTAGGLVQERMAPRALAPEKLQSIAQQGEEWQAVGDGAIRFRDHLEAAGVVVAPDCSPLHLLSAEAICELGARAEAVASSYETVVPDYRRRPDAEIALERK